MGIKLADQHLYQMFSLTSILWYNNINSLCETFNNVGADCWCDFFHFLANILQVSLQKKFNRLRSSEHGGHLLSVLTDGSVVSILDS